jgi:hypothetical protein
MKAITKYFAYTLLLTTVAVSCKKNNTIDTKALKINRFTLNDK